MTAPDTDGRSVRPAEQGDLLAVFRIERRTFPQPWPYAAFERYLDAPAFLVAVEDGSVVGYVVADAVPNHGEGFGHVKDLAVHGERRHEGIGSTLLSRALAELADAGAQSVKLEVREGNEAARALYEAFGFEYLKRVPGYYADGEAALVLVRSVEGDPGGVDAMGGKGAAGVNTPDGDDGATGASAPDGDDGATRESASRTD